MHSLIIGWRIEVSQLKYLLTFGGRLSALLPVCTSKRPCFGDAFDSATDKQTHSHGYSEYFASLLPPMSICILLSFKARVKYSKNCRLLLMASNPLKLHCSYKRLRFSLSTALTLLLISSASSCAIGPKGSGLAPFPLPPPARSPPSRDAAP